ncbi:riboflavin synthase [Radiobacillus kanasensis]|uniref:riboflavin synthase n=1 Tax=Radiobacillus kanasensis TaxID=2844358 RepID=UPI001E2E7C98|nr:riboflavin synthase [Radiobacillus kanasensis]UFU00305.1 riboflavin synthase [Radiobacillus kanasensis]
MFTGIVEEKGKVKSITRNQKSLSLIIKATKLPSDLAIGDSVAVNGVCLTVTQYTSDSFMVDVIPETFRATSLAEVSVGSSVNLERAMHASGRFGGHFVSGHVDTVGEIGRTWREDNALYVSVKIPADGLPYLTKKGSICVDGTSLTVFNVRDNGFDISLIPETQRATILGNKQQGDRVNVEFDMLAKYMERFLTFHKEKKSSEITMAQLEKYGFID